MLLAHVIKLGEGKKDVLEGLRKVASGNATVSGKIWPHIHHHHQTVTDKKPHNTGPVTSVLPPLLAPLALAIPSLSLPVRDGLGNCLVSLYLFAISYHHSSYIYLYGGGDNSYSPLPQTQIRAEFVATLFIRFSTK